MDQAVAELLEQEERKVTEKNAAKARSSSDAIDSPARLAHRDRRDVQGRGNHDRYSTEREENDARRSRKSEQVPEDEVMKDGSDKGSANGSVRSRRRSRSPGPDRRRRSSRDDNTYRDRRDDRTRDDYYRPGGGRRSVDRAEDDDRYYRPGNRRDRREDGPPRDRRDDGPPRDRRDDRAPRERTDRDTDRSHRGRDGPQGRDRRRSPQSNRRARTPEPTDDERDRRTVFVQQLAARLRTKELQAFFEQVGPVVEAQIVKDRVSGRSKG